MRYFTQNYLNWACHYTLVLFLSGFLLVTIPFWVPIYLILSSVSRSYNIIGTIFEMIRNFFNYREIEPYMYAVLKDSGTYLKIA